MGDACQELMTPTDRKNLPQPPAVHGRHVRHPGGQFITTPHLSRSPLTPLQARDRWPSVVTRPSLHRWSTYIQFASDRKTRPTVDDYDRPGRWWWMRCRTHSERFPMHWQTSGQIRWQTAQRRKYDSWGLGVGGNAVDLVCGIGIEFSLSCLVASWVAVSVGHAIW